MIILPKLPTAQMTQRVSDDGQPRCLNAMTTRTMLAWGHAKFRTRAADTLRFLPAVRMLHASEHYTSKGPCGGARWLVLGTGARPVPAVC